MAHKKAGGSKARQGGNVSGKRLGVKVSGGSKINAGQIILRQRGSVCKAGVNSGLGKDHTIFAKKDGVVSFRNSKGRKFIDVLLQEKLEANT